MSEAKNRTSVAGPKRESAEVVAPEEGPSSRAKQRPMSARRLDEVVHATAFLVAARVAYDSGEGQQFKNAFRGGREGHGVTDAQNVLIAFLESQP